MSGALNAKTLLEAILTEAALWYRKVEDGPQNGKVGCATPTGGLSVEIGKTTKQWRIDNLEATVEQVAESMIETFLTCNSRADGSDLMISNLIVYDAYAPRADECVRLIIMEYYELPVWRLEQLEKRFTFSAEATPSSSELVSA
ncbi:MAG: hypothetical protein CMP20_09415 [Rickettsiales bacterium]|nr:hypothetical protein [Rickettsiales bacterium]